MRQFVSICACASTLLFAQFARANTLTFDPASQSPGQPVPAGFGSDSGDTPNVAVSYTNVSWYGNDNLNTNPVTPGNIPDVTYPTSGEETGGIGNPWTYTFTADPGYLVTLSSFTAGYNSANPPTFSYTITGGTPDPISGSLFTEANPPVGFPGDTITPVGATGNVITLTFKLTSGTPGAGIGIDNIVLSQAVAPEPASACILGLFGTGLLVRRRRI